ncbi:MAG: RAD55 family ATPase [Armatimonadota bacterium]|nr:RAD55 family ATPase [Armatimonadota bacterium]
MEMGGLDNPTRSVKFSPLDGILAGPLPFGTAWQVEGDSGVGKTVLAAQFAVQGLRRGESVVFVAADDSPARVRASLQQFGFALGTYEREGSLLMVDAFSEGGTETYALADRADSEELTYLLADILARIQRPARILIDSLTSLAAYMSPSDLIHLVYEKNRILKRPDVVLLDVFLSDTLETRDMNRVSNAYDVILRLFYAEDRGGMPRRNLRACKVRGSTFDPRPFPFTIHREHGLLVDSDYYQR